MQLSGLILEGCSAENNITYWGRYIRPHLKSHFSSVRLSGNRQDGTASRGLSGFVLFYARLVKYTTILAQVAPSMQMRKPVFQYS